MGIYNLLADHHEFSSGWPEGDWPVTGRFTPSRFEVILGAVLTQNTRWENVEMALAAMVKKGLTSAGKIVRAEITAIEDAVRSSGFFRQKASVLQHICRLWESTGGIPPIDITRNELLDIPRIGPETADSILLYALNRPEFIADNYTRRLVERLGMSGASPDYYSVKRLFEGSLPQDPTLFKKYHALIVQHARKYCRKTPLCPGCPLKVSGKCRFHV